ncbi:putative Zn-finger protein, partial [Rhizoctonia solani 123E]
MEHGPEWQEFTLTVSTTEGSETFVIYWRNPIDIIAYLIRQKRFQDHMNFGPERHWTITLDGRKIRVYSEMWTGDWWWRLQNLLGEGATLAPFILATDCTQMTKLSGSKVAWPVYASIGNISSHIRRRPSEHAMVLIGYLPVAKLHWIKDPRKRREERWKLYHSALAMMLEPLRAAARDGVEMLCADGGVRRIHPIISTHLGDWPEMCLFGTCLKTRCPVCVAEDDEMEVLEPAARLRTKTEVLSAFRYARQGYAGMQVGLGLRPTWPYWALHPWASGPGMVVPDLLHQLWKGVFLDQIRPWWTKIVGLPEMDQRYASIPRYPSLRHYSAGLSPIAQWTGNEARAIAKSFLGVVASDSPEMGVEAARALMDFTFRARQPQLDEDDLARLDHDLREFHATREVFLTRGAYKGEDFNHFAKMHMMGHYTHQIREWGAPDGYNTEGPERLHIEYVKIPYGTTSGVEPEGQMIRYLQRIEALCIRRAELERAGVIEPRKRRYRPDDDMSGFEASEGDESEDELDVMMGDWEGQGAGKAREQSAYQPEPAVSIAKEPTLPIVPASTIIETYRAPGFLEAVRLHLETQNCNLAYIISDEPTFGVYHKITLVHPPLPFAPLGGPRNELVRASPARYNAHGLVRRSAFFDTVLIESNHCASGLQRYCPARVLVIFQLPRHLLKQYSQVMAYVELFDEFAPNIPEQHGLPITEPLRHNGQPVRLVIPVTDLRLACHLLPDYASLRQRFPDSRWDSSTDMLSFAHRFFLNRHVNYYFFALMDHWRRIDNHQRIQ